MVAVDFFREFGRVLFGELGDKTFFFAVVMTAWCPWNGVRCGRGVGVQQCLVFWGCYTALSIQVILEGTLEDVKPVGAIFSGIACGFLLILGLRAFMTISQEQGTRSKEPSDAGMDESDAPKSETSTEGFTWNKTAFMSSDYGSIAPPVSADGALAERPSDRRVSEVLALIISLIVVFFLEVGDKSQWVILAGNHVGGPLIIAGMLGFLPAMVLATVLGIMLERQFATRLTAMLACFGLCALFLITLSDTYLLIPGM